MTITNEPTTTPEEASPLGVVFADLGILTIEQAIAQPERLLELGDEHLESYCKMAAVRWSGVPSPTPGRSWEDFGEMFGMLLMQAFGLYGVEPVLDDEGRECCELGGRGGEKLPLTLSSLQHWQWINALMGNEATAEAFLAVVPAYARAAGRDQASQVTGNAFASIVEEVQS